MCAIQSLQLKGYTYKYVEKHRTITVYSSRWTISFIEEREIFSDCVNKNYLEKIKNKTIGYNLSKYKNGYKDIGINCKGENVKLSKFIIDGKEAHGYPADYVNKHQDKPNEETLLAMKKNELISNMIYKNILKGRAI